MKIQKVADTVTMVIHFTYKVLLGCTVTKGTHTEQTRSAAGLERIKEAGTTEVMYCINRGFLSSGTSHKN
jgi:hypothetical protein